MTSDTWYDTLMWWILVAVWATALGVALGSC